jgi:hypothetical protein
VESSLSGDPCRTVCLVVQPIDVANPRTVCGVPLDVGTANRYTATCPLCLIRTEHDERRLDR